MFTTTVNQAGEWIIVESSVCGLNLVDYYRSRMRSGGMVELPTLFAASVTWLVMRWPYLRQFPSSRGLLSKLGILWGDIRKTLPSAGYSGRLPALFGQAAVDASLHTLAGHDGGVLRQCGFVVLWVG